MCRRRCNFHSATVDTGGGWPARGVHLAELIPLYIEHVQDTYRGKDASYASRKATDLSEYVAAHWKHPSEISADAWKEVMKTLHHGTGGPLRWRSIAHLAHTLRAFLEWCLDKHTIEEVPPLEVPSTKTSGWTATNDARSPKTRWSSSSGCSP